MVIITGDKGFIGSELKTHLLEQGVKVHSLDWHDRGRTYTLPEPVEWIFHMGAISETIADDWQDLVRKNIQDTQAWIKFAQQHNCGITYASSASLYGPWSNSPEWGPVQPMHMYAVSKLAVDNWCATQNFTVPVQGVRFFNVYGRNEGHKRQPSPVRRYIVQGIVDRKLTVFQHQGRLGSRDFVSVDDCIDAMLRLKHTGTSGVFNIGSGVQLTFQDIAQCVQKHFGVSNVQVQVVPMPDDMVKSYQWQSQANLQKLVSTIGDWNPCSVDQWLEKNFESLYNSIRKEML